MVFSTGHHLWGTIFSVETIPKQWDDSPRITGQFWGRWNDGNWIPGINGQKFQLSGEWIMKQVSQKNTHAHYILLYIYNVYIYIYTWILIGRSFSWISRDCQPWFFFLDYYDYYIRYLYIYIHVWIVDGTNHDVMKFSGSSPAPLQAPCCAWGSWNSSAAMRFERMDKLRVVGCGGSGFGKPTWGRFKWDDLNFLNDERDHYDHSMVNRVFSLVYSWELTVGINIVWW